MSSRLVKLLRRIANHFNSMADAVERREDKVCKVIDLLNDLDDSDLRQMVEYAESVLALHKAQW